MKARFNFLLQQWAEQTLTDAWKDGSRPSVNAVERICSDPGRASYGSKDRVLWWPRPGTNWLHKRAHQLTALETIVLIVSTGILRGNDGEKIDAKRFCQLTQQTKTPVNLRKFNEIKRKATKTMKQPKTDKFL